MSRIAIIDLGSNSLKLFVFERQGRRLQTLHRETREERLSTGLGWGEQPVLQDQAMQAVATITGELHQQALTFAPEAIRIVSTSAVRDADNREIFCSQVEQTCGLRPEILSGEEEARLIGRGVTTDPALLDMRGTFTLLDIGGGSAELIEFVRGEIREEASLPLGAVRLTERFISDPSGPLDDETIERIALETERCLQETGMDLSSMSRPMVGTGGAFVVLRAMLAARAGQPLEKSDAHLFYQDLAELLASLAPLTYQERCQLPALSPKRADILPSALISILTIGQIAQAKAFIHSFHSLPHGLALAASQGEI